VRALVALADNLTGALEAGAQFAGRGIASVVTLDAAGCGDYPVVVIDTESRHLTAEEAAARVACCALDARVIYKKTDSTLRGNIGAELRALSSKYPEACIAYVPAYPALGRTVKRGCLYVWGTPVHQTEFAADALNPIASSAIADVLPDHLPCRVYNGKTDADVAQATAAALADTSCRIIGGPWRRRWSCGNA
jgi:uncharacterized protein YgbK (DUF1537 family)